jgi:hypothetical protein
MVVIPPEIYAAVASRYQPIAATVDALRAAMCLACRLADVSEQLVVGGE